MLPTQCDKNSHVHTVGGLSSGPHAHSFRHMRTHHSETRLAQAGPARPGSHLDLALQEAVAEVRDLFCCQLVRLRLVLGHLLLQGDEAHGRALLLLEAEELKDALVVGVVTVDEYKQDLGGEKAR